MKLCFRSAKLTKKCSIPSQKIKGYATNKKKICWRKKNLEIIIHVHIDLLYKTFGKDTECGIQYTNEYMGNYSLFVITCKPFPVYKGAPHI